jgi:hypothetical protein
MEPIVWLVVGGDILVGILEAVAIIGAAVFVGSARLLTRRAIRA